MCVVIDSCCLSRVFNQKDRHHDGYTPVFEWIMEGKGKVVYGGTTYKRELAKTKYIAVFNELRRAGKVVLIADEKVDDHENAVRDIYDGEVNDPHIIAIIRSSGCRILCSEDTHAFPFFKNTDSYQKNSLRPKIYKGTPANQKLIHDGNLAKICQGCT